MRRILLTNITLYVLVIITGSCNGQDNEVKNGEVKRYYPDGNINNVTTYVQGKKEGRSIGYFEDGKISFYITYKNDKFYGVTKWYYSNGNLNHEEYWDEKGVNQGVFKIWYKSGKLRQTGFCVNGMIIGKSIQYYDNENVESVYNYDKSGLKDSIWVYYSQDKSILKREIYKADSLVQTIK